MEHCSAQLQHRKCIEWGPYNPAYSEACDILGFPPDKIITPELIERMKAQGVNPFFVDIKPPPHAKEDRPHYPFVQGVDATVAMRDAPMHTKVHPTLRLSRMLGNLYDSPYNRALSSFMFGHDRLLTPWSRVEQSWQYYDWGNSFTPANRESSDQVPSDEMVLLVGYKDPNINWTHTEKAQLHDHRYPGNPFADVDAGVADIIGFATTNPTHGTYAEALPWACWIGMLLDTPAIGLGIGGAVMKHRVPYLLEYLLRLEDSTFAKRQKEIPCADPKQRSEPLALAEVNALNGGSRANLERHGFNHIGPAYASLVRNGNIFGGGREEVYTQELLRSRGYGVGQPISPMPTDKDDWLLYAANVPELVTGIKQYFKCHTDGNPFMPRRFIDHPWELAPLLGRFLAQ